MKLTKRSTDVADPGTWFLRIGVMVLVIGFAAFGFMYYQDQHVDAGPSLTDRQTTSAEQAVKKNPNNIGARLALAASYLSVKRLDDSVGQYDEILKADKANRYALLGRGQALIAKGDLTAAAADYHKITTAVSKGEFAGADPQLQEAHYYLGSIAVKQGNVKVAITELGDALIIDKTDSDALYQMGLARVQEGSTQLAVDAFKRALLFVPTGWCEPYTQLNLAYTKLGNTPQATYDGAMANFCHKKPVEAKRQLNTLTTGPAKVDAMNGLGLIAETESSNPEAISWYQKVLKVDSANASATSSLSRLGVKPTSSAKK